MNVIRYAIVLAVFIAFHNNLLIAHQITLEKYCKNYVSNTIQPKIEPIICPNTTTYYVNNFGAEKYLCPRYNSNITISHYANQKLYKNTKLYWNKLLIQFIKHLDNYEVYLMGDSLTLQAYYQFQCISEFANVIDKAIIYDQNTHIPSPIKSSMYDFSKRFGIERPRVAKAEKWYYNIRNNLNIKYVIVNTGMWWNPSNFKNLQTNSIITNMTELLDIYRMFFQLDSPFLTRLYDLKHNHNKIILWRDTAPAGSCTETDTYEYHKVLSQMNIIAHQSLEKIGVIIIPHIWEESLPYWKLHIEGQYNDYVHYCLFQSQAVQNLWIKNIIETILRH